MDTNIIMHTSPDKINRPPICQHITTCVRCGTVGSGMTPSLQHVGGRGDVETHLCAGCLDRVCSESLAACEALKTAMDDK